MRWIRKAGIPMREWWTPARQFALYHPVTGAFVSAHATAARAWRAAHALWLGSGFSQYRHASRVVTIDLDSGEEVAA